MLGYLGKRPKKVWFSKMKIHLSVPMSYDSYELQKEFFIQQKHGMGYFL